MVSPRGDGGSADVLALQLLPILLRGQPPSIGGNEF